MKKSFIQKGFFLIFLLFVEGSMFGQINLKGLNSLSLVTITGDTNVVVNQTKTYTASAPGVTIFAGSWTVFGATIVNQNATSVTINWTSSGGKFINYTATSTSSGVLEGFTSVIVNGGSSLATPSSPTILSQNCGTAVLLRGTPPIGSSWYWQGTNSNGTSTSNSSSTYSVTTSGKYYLRARNIIGIWSLGSSYVDVLIGSNGGTIWYADTDGDQLGDPNSTIIQCTKPSGYVSNSSDQCPTTHGGGTPNGCPITGGLSNENYVYTIAPQKPVTSISGLTQNKDAIKSVTYYDGLGRPKQSIGIKQSNTEKDIVTHIEYDALGRQKKDFLPYAVSGSNGNIVTGNVGLATQSYYKNKYADDFPGITDANLVNAYSEKVFDNSPLNRVLEQAAPGKDWKVGNGHTIKFEYDTNTSSEVKNYYVTTSFSSNTCTPTLQLNTSVNQGNYNASELYKTITKDENWQVSDGLNHTTEEFKNKQGQVILKRTYNNSQKHDTYYVYDDFGNLTYVLPPKSEPQTAKPDSVELSELCYQYKYDYRNRLVEKKIPGKGWEYIVYDNLDRPVLTQDANLKAKSPDEWLFTKYDALGRVIYTGIYKYDSSRDTLQTTFNNKTATQNYESKLTSSGYSGSYYSNNHFPKTNIEILTINYFDNYLFNRAGAGGSANSYNRPSTTRTKGLATGSKVKILDTNNWSTTVTYYDDKARPIYIYSKNEYLLSTDIVESKLDFVGKVLETTSIHTKTDDNLPTITTIDKFDYDHVGKLKKQTQKIGSQAEEIIVYNTYDELGQLKNKGVGGKTTQARLQTVNYTYNVRGWLKEINNLASIGNDIFAFKINYNTVNHGATKLFNGNISETEWKSKSDNELRWYKYSYDALNRIESGVDNLNRYSLSNVDYDKNGNITKLERRGHIVANPNKYNNTHFGLMDDLQYTYSSRSNKLTRVQELSGGNTTFGFKNGSNATTEYTYDSNGNMVKDLNKGITSNIGYNHLNLPTEIKFNNSNSKKINYIYDATGVKLRKTVNDNGNIITTDYANGFIYKKTGTGVKELQFFNTPEGYVQNSSGTFNYVYQYKDHLGSVRLSYSDTNNDGVIQTGSNSEIIEEKNYYPFGLKHRGYNNVTSPNGNSIAQKFGYNGTELEESLGLNLMEMDMRQYDPAIARWTSIDPVIHYNYSTYSAFDNNPVFWSDPSGADSYKYNFETKQYEQYDDDGKLINDNASFKSALKWAESQNSNDNDEEQPSSMGEADSGNGGGSVMFITAKEAAKRAAQKGATSTATATASGLSSTSAGVLSLALLLNGDTDPAIKKWRENEKKRVYVTYRKYGPNGEVYVGRASGFGTPEEVVARRDASHHMNVLGFAPAVLDQSGVGTPGSMAIRGREQQLIDSYGGAHSDSSRRINATSANRIRGVSKVNPKGFGYHNAASKAFGEVYKFTGYFKL